MIELFQYPVMTITKENLMGFARNADELSICSRKSLKHGFFNGLIIVDSSGDYYRIDSAEKIGTVGLFFGLSLFYGQRLRVKINLSQTFEKLSIDQLKLKIVNSIKKDKYFWDSGGDKNKIIQIVEKSTDFSQLINFLTNKFYKEYN